MDLVGSRFGTKDVPVLRLDDQAPLLTGRWNDHAYPKWGAPSCGNVVGLDH